MILEKYLVGETITFEVPLSDDFLYEVEVYTNINRSPESIPLRKINGVYSGSLLLTKSGYYHWQVRFRRRPSKTWHWLKDGETRETRYIQVDPAWLADAMVYNVFVRFFNGKTIEDGTLAPGDGGTFDDVKAHLDALQSMGVNVLYFNPIHLIGELYRKHNLLDQLPTYLQPGSPYSIKDYKSIDPELTYDKDTKKHLLSDPQKEFKDLIDACHERGMYVIMDIVFNHTSHDFVFQRIRPEWYLYKDNITSIEDPYLYPEDVAKGLPWGDPAHTMAPYDHGMWWEDAAQLNWEYMIPEGPNKAPKNTTIAEMWEYFKSIPQYWIRHFGVDGFRCDIAYRVPTAFWKACIAEARELAQEMNTNLAGDVVFIAEAFTNNLRELQEAGFAAVYGDYSHKLGKPLDLKGYLDYMYNLSGTHFPKGSKWFIFPECHDFGRTPQKVLGDNAEDPTAAYLANQSRWLLTATLPGIPLIFNGFEKIEWQPINLFSYGAVNWERNSDLKEFISSVNHIRLTHPALTRGAYHFLETNQGVTEETQLFAFARSHENEQLIVVVNMDVYSDALATITLPDSYSGAYTLVDLLTQQSYVRSGRELLVELKPGQGHVFKRVS